MIVRAATSADVEQVRAIYAHHVLHGTGTFEEVPPMVESRSKNYLTMAMEEIASGKIRYEYTK